MRKAARWAAGLVIAAWIILLTAWLTLHWGILPRIDEWRPQIERRAGRALGVPLRIGRIEVESRGWVPSFELRDVVISDPQGREALKLPRVAAAVSARSLLALQARFEQLLIEAPEVEVRRSANGRLLVAGIDFGAPQDPAQDEGAAADWFFSQPEFVVRGGLVRWIDESRSAGALELRDVSFVLRNGVRSHDLRLDATPPADWGDRFSIAGRFTRPFFSRAGDVQRWRGALHAQLPRVDVRELRRHATLPFELDDGRGALRAWIEIGAKGARAATLDFALVRVSMRLGSSLERIRLQRIEGRVAASRDDDGSTYSAERFGFVDDAGVAWPQGSSKLVLRGRPGAPPTGGSFEADRLDLALLVGLAERIPLGDALHKLLAELSPRGVVHDLKARWDGPLDAPQRYQVKARMTGFALASKAAAEAGAIGRPGMANADIELNASERGGDATLSMASGSLDLPGVFEEPQVRLQQLSTQLGWRIDAAKAAAPPRVEVSVRNLRFANADARGELNAKWSTGPGSGFARAGRYPGLLELDGKIERGLAASVARYLPLGLPANVRRYVQRAVKSGSVGPATFRVKGDLWDFPFRDARHGEFRIVGRVGEVAFDYVPSIAASVRESAFASPWPGLTRLGGELVFERMSMQMRDARAQLGGFELVGASAGIRDFADPVLVVEGSGSGALADALRFVGTTPVSGWTSGALANATASGSAELKLALRMPLADLDRTTVQGSIVLADNDVRLRPDVPLLAHARARVDFTHKGFTISRGAAQVLGGEASFAGGTQPDGTLRFTGQGTATAEGLQRARELGSLLPLVARHLAGQTAYRVALTFDEGEPDVLVTSSLAGLASDLPPPLAKRAEATLPLSYHSEKAPDWKPNAPRDLLRLELGSVVQAHFTRDTSGDVSRVLHGGVGVGAQAPEPTAGVHANVGLASLDVDAWRAVLDRIEAGAATGSAPSGPAQRAAVSVDAGYAPSRIVVRSGEAVIGGRKLTRLVAGLSLVDGIWRANLDADQLDGYAEWQPGRSDAGRVYARLVRLALPQSETQSLATLLDTRQPSEAPPALDVVIDDFELHGKKLGRVEIRATHRGAPARREWLLEHLAVKTPEAQFNAMGQWLAARTASLPRRTQIDFLLDLRDSGAYLERLGFGRLIRGGKGRLQGHIAWPGSPLAFAPVKLDGEIVIDIEAGQFLKVDPGAARLLGVLSLQALPRRLALDFRDVFEQGFPFDSITGDLKIAGGVAYTNNLRMRGVQAAVLLEGSADIARETQDVRVVVVPEINAGTASLAYAVINPALGIGTFLAQMILRKPIIQAATREFHLTGAWDDPRIVRVERKMGPAEESAAPPKTP